MRKPENLLGESESFLAVLDQVSRLAPIERPILILGERGTGKELIARRLHYLSKRWNEPLISLNCSALSEGLIDSELFGHESGSFTGSKGRHQGRFERAEGGTLFLDELATAPAGVQEKLLRVIEYGEYERVGGTKTINADVRLICATNENVADLANSGRFRADLLDRLAFDVIHLPPLRHRQADIMLLAEHYAMQMCQELGLTYFAGFSTKVTKALETYSWPGNIRELKNVVERAVFRHSTNTGEIEDIDLDPFTAPWHNTSPASSPPSANATPNHSSTLPSLPTNLKSWLQEQEVEMIQMAMSEAKFNQRKAADLLGLSYHQLRGILRKHHIVGENEDSASNS
ncbi:phage shock protein operon transcriptional activator [Vibrio sp. Of7-15]|uniref:phage shock protein operon transcriptional activator n=1 Tax=Vibrio sp. Of7-15 TaxID=2724879 RepID=UPI001EF262E0|nr:phage shock protein operon transcriptional activator [Vibrio sp. Of7-15]MCG7496110.1 phage shock protein operon transcriptional activator [Vibrio sp. Of7-15]